MPSRKGGQGLVEYIVLLALASLIGVVVVSVAGQQLSDAFTRVSAAVANPMELLATPTPAPTPSFAPHLPADSPPAATPTAPPAAPAPTPAHSPQPTAAPTAAPAPTPAPHSTPTSDVDQQGGHQGP